MTIVYQKLSNRETAHLIADKVEGGQDHKRPILAEVPHIGDSTLPVWSPKDPQGGFNLVSDCKLYWLR